MTLHFEQICFSLLILLQVSLYVTQRFGRCVTTKRNSSEVADPLRVCGVDFSERSKAVFDPWHIKW